LEGALAYVEGTIREVTNHGDHDIVVAEMDYASTEPGEPLIYYRGGYRDLT
jgi:flavin reductase (DIM6/NTAB) family NADH-FMN oxidoreductase RutF